MHPHPIHICVKCPECGGPVHYLEGAHTFKCPFCESVLRIKRQEGVELTYIIPCRLKENEIESIIKRLKNRKNTLPQRQRDATSIIKHRAANTSIKQIRTIYKPFWYFKGILYYSYVTKGENDTLSRIWYHSFQANPDFISSFNTLSVRTQVISLEPYDSEIFEHKGIIIPLTMKKEEAYEHAKNAASISLQMSVENALYKKQHIIGEQLFIIYYPLIQVVFSTIHGKLTDMIIDGISKDPLEDKAGYNEEFALNSDKHDTPSYRITLLTHRCKNCGSDLKAKEFAIVFYCENCFRLWLLKESDYHPLKIKMVETEKEEDCVFVPFWRFEVVIHSEMTGIEIKAIGGLSTFMKMGRFLLRMQEPTRPIRLLCPALVSRNARALLKLTRRINIAQKELPLTEKGNFPAKQAFNASVPEDEAKQMLEVVVFSVIGRQDKRAIDFYKDFNIAVTKSELIWYPFEDKGDFLLDPIHQYSFPKKSMDTDVFCECPHM